MEDPEEDPELGLFLDAEFSGEAEPMLGATVSPSLTKTLGRRCRKQQLKQHYFSQVRS